MRKTLACAALTLCLTAVGCVASPASSTPTTLTIAQQTAKDQASVRLGTALATKAALLAVNDADVQLTAQIIHDVANVIVAATANDTLDLTTLRTMASQEVAKRVANPKQKLIAAQLVDTIGMLVQDRIDSDATGLATTDRRVLAIGLIRAAATGALEATAIFVPTP